MSTIIIGSGIIGLTTAIRLLESQYPNSNKEVIIIASRLPTDENLTKDPEYASACAGAHHLSFAADDDERQARWDRRSESGCSLPYLALSMRALCLREIRSTVIALSFIHTSRPLIPFGSYSLFLIVIVIAFEIMQSELLTEGEKSTGLMSLRQTEFFTGEEKHLKFLEGYPDVSPSPHHSTVFTPTPRIRLT